MRQTLNMLCAGLLGTVAFIATPGAAFAAPMSQAAQIGYTVNNSYLLQNTQGYYGGGRYYRDEEYEDTDAIDEDGDRDRDQEENSIAGEDEDPGDYREESAAPPPPPPYRPYRHKPHIKKWGPNWSSDGKPVWRSDRFTPEFCYMCLGTCSEGRSCAPRCWGWRRYCRKHDF
jgi:hypothetical protein